MRYVARFLLPVAALLILAASAHAASPPTGGGMPAGGMAPTMPLPDPTVELQQLQQLAVQVGQQFYSAFVPCLQYLGTTALQIGLAMAGLGMAFGGRGRSIASVFVEICVLSAIVWVFCIGMWPQRLLGNLRPALLQPAVQLGNTIAHLGPGVSGNTPTQWLMSWLLGQQAAAGATFDLGGTASTCKFSIHYIQDVLWADHTAVETIRNEGMGLDMLLKGSATVLDAQSIALWSAFLFGLGSIFTAFLGAYLAIIVSIFGFALTQLFVLGGAELAWDLYVPLGMLLIPLIYLGIGRDYWRHYLTTLVALAILPAMYWLMASLGVALMAALYNAIFFSVGSVGAFVRSAVVYATGGMIGDVWNVIASLLSRLIPGFVMPGAVSGNMLQFLKWSYYFSGYWLRYTAGVGLTELPRL